MNCTEDVYDVVGLSKKMKGVQNFLVHRLDLSHVDKTDLSKILSASTLSPGVYNTVGKGINSGSGKSQTLRPSKYDQKT